MSWNSITIPEILPAKRPMSSMIRYSQPSISIFRNTLFESILSNTFSRVTSTNNGSDKIHAGRKYRPSGDVLRVPDIFHSLSLWHNNSRCGANLRRTGHPFPVAVQRNYLVCCEPDAPESLFAAVRDCRRPRTSIAAFRPSVPIVAFRENCRFFGLHRRLTLSGSFVPDLRLRSCLFAQAIPGRVDGGVEMQLSPRLMCCRPKSSAGSRP